MALLEQIWSPPLFEQNALQGCSEEVEITGIPELLTLQEDIIT